MKEGFVDSLITVIYFPPHFMSLGFMVWASCSLVLDLRRHKQRVQHICRNRPSHEARATRTILILILILWYILFSQQHFDNLDDSSCKLRPVDGEHLGV